METRLELVAVACSIAIGRGLTRMAPGSLDDLQMVIPDADAQG